MLHEILYVLHILGMAAIIAITLFLVIKKNNPVDFRKKFSLYLLSASHTQLLTGFVLFFLLLSDLNHMKIGIKMLLAIGIAVLATIYRRKINSSPESGNVYLFSILIIACVTTIIAFFL